MNAELKYQTARSVKWNIIDKVSQQLLYAATGIILARLLSQEDFGLVGAILVFQAFASLFVDSGFSYALIQRKAPTRLDYSTVLWFNIGVATLIYVILFFCAPLIANLFQGDQRLIPLSRVMFLSFILNATAIVQTNRLMKRMEMKMVAVSNGFGLLLGGVVGIWLAFAGKGAWAIVWQTLTLNFAKSAVLWLTTGWKPVWQFSLRSLRSFFRLGSSMMGSSMLNVLFQNIYSFFIGNRVGLVPLGYYTQADKWSKIGVGSMTQVLTSSFLPALSEVQEDPARFAAVTSKMNRFTSYLLFPLMGFLIVMAEPIFHTLFGSKWDSSIVLFQLLLVRGVFTVLSTLYNNYAIALAKAKMVIAMEIVRDGAALIFLVATLPLIALTRGVDIVYGIKLLLIGQIAASALSWMVMVIKTAPLSGRKVSSFLFDSFPYLVETVAIMVILYVESLWISDGLLLPVVQSVTALGCYVAINGLLGSAVQRDLFAYLRR